MTIHFMVLEYNLTQPSWRHVKWPFSINNYLTHYYRAGWLVIVVLSVLGIVLERRQGKDLWYKITQYAVPICHISFHITNNYFSGSAGGSHPWWSGWEHDEHVVFVHGWEFTSRSDTVTHIKWSFSVSMEMQQPCLLWFMLNGYVDCKCRKH